MTRESFHETLEKLELELLSMGELSANAVQRSVAVRSGRTTMTARAPVIDGDDQIDDLYLHIDRRRHRAPGSAVAGGGGPAADLRHPALAACTWSGSATRR